jgi:tetratricopeptide (TPR) repeat protein
MHKWPCNGIRALLRCLLLVAVSMNFSLNVGAQDSARLGELLYGEALFHSHQQDYLSAISRLQMAEAQGLLPSSSGEAALLLARMKLAYGMHLEAGFDLHALLGEDVPPPLRNRAWYDLGRAFFHKRYNQAAAEALANVRGEMPTDIIGDYQLLRATVLMSLHRNQEAAQELAQWRGAPELAAYAHYNRGIALVRAGDYAQVVPSLEMAVKMPARGEELLALRDKARLALGYAFAREDDYKRARKQLQAVRPQGPFSNRALLALGWLDYKQGRSESALAAWTELQGRSPTDPAVLETLLVVPAVHRELDALQMATRDYEAAVAAYNTELDRLHGARESVQKGEAVEQLLQSDTRSGLRTQGTANQEAARFLGPLLASRDFAELHQSHSELRAMLDNMDKGLREIDALPKGNTPEKQAEPKPTSAAMPQAHSEQRSAPPLPAQSDLRELEAPQLQRDWVLREGETVNRPKQKVPQLPEVESPSQRTLKPFPERELPSRPAISNYIREPPSPEITGLSESEILWLPNSGEFFQRPKSGEFFKRPGEEVAEDYAYPDVVPRKRSKPGDAYAYQLNRLLPAGDDQSGFDSGAVPVGEALRDLAAALSSATQRMAALNGSYGEDAGLEQRIAALRLRILKLRARTAKALDLYENYTRTLALDELDRRQSLLEGLLQQASLELAKTYDQNSDR